MSLETPSKPTKLCPTCGTRVSEDAPRCQVCGTDLTNPAKSSKAANSVQGSRIPVITVNLPLALGLLALFIAIGASLVYFAMRQPAAQTIAPTNTPTVTITPTASNTPTPVTPTTTNTPEPSPTPFTYKVALGDTCSTIAFRFGVSIQSIVLLNELPAACDTLFESQSLLIPQPTPTVTPLPTATLSEAEATDIACPKIEYTVQDNDTLSSISANYAVPIVALKSYNGRVNDTVRSGEVLIIPLCERAATPGPSPTPTPPPPYPAANLLLPADGAPFSAADSTVTLQWAAVGALRENEAYAVTVADVTEGLERKLVEYVTDTKFIIPTSFRPNDNIAHIIRWSILPVRQTGTDDDGNPIWEPAGAVSDQRVFSWTGSGSAPPPVTTPAP
jgi:LysM repeat protein